MPSAWFKSLQVLALKLPRFHDCHGAVNVANAAEHALLTTRSPGVIYPSDPQTWRSGGALPAAASSEGKTTRPSDRGFGGDCGASIAA